MFKRVLTVTVAAVALTLVGTDADACTSDRGAYLREVSPAAARYDIAPSELIAMGRLTCEVDHPRRELIGSWYADRRLVNTVVRSAQRHLC